MVQIRNKSEPKADPSGKPTIKFFLTIYPISLELTKNSSCHTLSKIFGKSMKALWTTKDGFTSKVAKVSKMLCVLAISWCTLESLGRNPDLINKFHLRTRKYYQITFPIFLNKLPILILVMVIVLIKWEYNAKNY